MADLQKAGKVRAIGVSNYSAEQMERCTKIAPVTSDQPPYSILRRKLNRASRPCKDHNVGIIVYSPMLSRIDRRAAESAPKISPPTTGAAANRNSASRNSRKISNSSNASAPSATATTPRPAQSPSPGLC